MRLVFAVALLLGCPPTADDDSVVLDCQELASTAEKPEVTIVAPTNPYSTTADDNISWIVTAVDPDSDVTELSWRMYDTIEINPEDVAVTIPATDGDGRTEFVMSAALLSEGAHPLHVEATDPDGCFAEEQVVVCVDTVTCP